MRVSLALLADYSNVSREGKLNILGIFDTIYAPGFPTTHAHMQLVVRFEADAREAGATRQVEVQFRTQDGTVLFRLPGAMTVQPGELGETIRTDLDDRPRHAGWNGDPGRGTPRRRSRTHRR